MDAWLAILSSVPDDIDEAFVVASEITYEYEPDSTFRFLISTKRLLLLSKMEKYIAKNVKRMIFSGFES